MNKRTPLCLICSVFMLLVFLSIGYLASKKFFLDGPSPAALVLDYDTEANLNLDSSNDLNTTASTIWDMHKEIKTRNSLKIHLFNVENPEDVLKGKKPKLRETGPYTYEQIQKRVTLGIFEDQDAVKYKDHVVYHFKPEQSKGSEQDIATIINMPWVGLAQEAASMSAFSRFIVMAIVSRFSESVFMTRPVHELLFGGFYHELISTFSGITGETYMPNNTFGLFYGRNDTFLNPREVNLGLKNYKQFGQVQKWKGQSRLEWWGKPDTEDDSSWFDEEEEKETSTSEKVDCNALHGNDWNMFHPEIQKDETLSVFSDLQCRSFKLRFEKDVEVKGVKGYRFVIPPSEYDTTAKKPDNPNQCYCTHPGDDGDDCPEEGAYQIHACNKGAAVLVSNPHFYQAHHSYHSKAEEGLRPEEEKHQTYIDIEPKTGQVLRYSKRVQVNLHLKPLKKIEDFKEVPNMIFPVMWTDESGEMTEENLLELKSKLKKYKFQLPTISDPVVGLSLLGMGRKFSKEGEWELWFSVGGVTILLVGVIVAAVSTWKKSYQHVSLSGMTKDEEGVEFITINEQNAPRIV